MKTRKMAQYFVSGPVRGLRMRTAYVAPSSQALFQNVFVTSRRIQRCKPFSTVAAEAATDVGTMGLKKYEDIPSVKSYPIIGSAYTLSNMPTTKRETKGPNVYSTLYQLYERHPTYKMKLPIVGQFVVETDPLEFTKVLQNEGKYPYSIVCISGSFFKQYAPKLWNLVPFKAIFSRGQEHIEARHFLNKGLFAPSAARGYTLLISDACRTASKNFPLYQKNVGDYMSLMSFEMFCAAYFGRVMQLTDRENGDLQDKEFVNAIRSIQVDPDFQSNTKLVATYLGYNVGFETEVFKKGKATFEIMMKHPKALINDFKDRMANDQLNEAEKGSYLYNAFKRGEDEKVDIGLLVQQGQVMLQTSADTTPLPLQWLLANLALNTQVQEKLANLLKGYLQGGDLTEEHLKSDEPAMDYLNAVIRENHRIRPTVVFSAFKKPAHEIEVHGYQIPEEQTVVLDTFSIQNDPSLVENPDQFIPERFLREAILARKGTSEAFIDHVTLQGPFSSGARMCPAARVVGIELKCLISRLVQDWKFEFRDKSIASVMDIPLVSSYNQAAVAAPLIPEMIITPRE